DHCRAEHPIGSRPGTLPRPPLYHATDRARATHARARNVTDAHNPRGSSMTRRTRSTALPALALLAGLAACGASDAPDRDAGENTRAAANSGAPAPDLAPSGAAAMDAALDPNAPAPEAKTGTIAVAGATAEITFKRF